jgi:hypothetical protein
VGAGGGSAKTARDAGWLEVGGSTDMRARSISGREEEKGGGSSCQLGLGRPKKENERKGEMIWASMPKRKNGRELGKGISFFFPSRFSNFIFKWFFESF